MSDPPTTHSRRGARARRVARSLLIAGVAAGLAGQATFASFSGSTQSQANVVTAGTVNLVDTDGGGALVSLSEASSGESSTGCIRITSDGSLDSTVRLYGSSSAALAPHLIVTIERGTMPTGTGFPNCTGFTPDATDYGGNGAGVIFKDRLSALPSTWAAGISDPTSGAPETWTTNEDHVYRVKVQLDPDGSGQGVAGGGATLTWEARNL